MNYKEITFKPSYESGVDDLVFDFYIPALSVAKRYDRITGFFSSTSLALASRGLAGLIKNKGKMRIVTCPRLSEDDARVIEESVLNNDNRFLSDKLISQLNIEDEFQKDHVEALGWMLSKNILEMKIALVYENNRLLNENDIISSSIMHQKVGILYDNEWNSISFSGSNNESAAGWMNNVEEFKVFSSWIDGQKPFYLSDLNKFEKLWNNNQPATKVVTLPDAVAENLIERSKNFNVDKLASKEYHYRNIKFNHKDKREHLKLFSYQELATKHWEDNNKRSILEMATGCGKTRTAIGCMKNCLSQQKRPLLIIVACPENTLSLQWKKDIKSLDINIDKDVVCDGTNHKWKQEINNTLTKLASGFYTNALVFTTHATSCKSDFINLINKHINTIDILFVGDECHGLGANKTKIALNNNYKYRLGLSATPMRWFDDEGSTYLNDYFGNNNFVFTLEDALRTINPATNKPFLVNYFYYPRFVNLTDEELDKYNELSKKITRLANTGQEDDQSILEFLLFKRADIEKTAFNKYHELDNILQNISEDINDTIIFVSPAQIQQVLQMLAAKGILAHSFTEQESTTPSNKYDGLSEREHIIKLFTEHKYQVLVAIKCLDEGIDIPSARRAIVMASSTNPREYIQRIGRVIRQSKNKKNAEIYDMIIKPDTSYFNNEDFAHLEKRIFLKEMDRVLDLSKNALNNVSVLNEMFSIKGKV